MSSEVAKVKSDKLRACMTCPLCDKLLEEATTTYLCLHTFCRKCIYDKLSDEDFNTCPVCDIDLGSDPLENLRPDHSWQNIIAKIFPFKGRKVEAPGIASSTFLPAKGEEDSMEDGLGGSSSSETLKKVIQNQKQGSSSKSSNDQICDEHIDNSNEGREGKVIMCKPLNNLVEAVNRSKFSKANLQGHSHPKGDPPNSEDSDDMNQKDGSMPVSYIQKYIVKKLDLANETEVQITCEKEYVMVLSYSKKVAEPTS